MAKQSLSRPLWRTGGAKRWGLATNVPSVGNYPNSVEARTRATPTKLETLRQEHVSSAGRKATKRNTGVQRTTDEAATQGILQCWLCHRLSWSAETTKSARNRWGNQHVREANVTNGNGFAMSRLIMESSSWGIEKLFDGVEWGR